MRGWERAVATVGVVLASGCGGGSRPAGPDPVANPPTTPPRPIVVSGPYRLTVEAAPDCGLPIASVSFRVTAAAAPSATAEGVQVVEELEPTPRLELEFKDSTATLRGGTGTTGEGVLAAEGVRVWLRAIGTGTVTPAADGRGEILGGALTGELSLGGPDDEEGALGVCTSLTHRFSLRPR